MSAQVVKAQVLWDSLFFRWKSSLAYDGTIVDGFDAINAVDWRDFSLFKNSAGTTNLDVDVVYDIEIDTASVWGLAEAHTGFTLELHVSDDGVTFTNMGAVTVNDDGTPSWTDFTPTIVRAGGKIRFVFDGDSFTWRQLSAGPKVEFPTGQWAGINPTNLYQGVVVENVIATNGSIIGRNIRRLQKAGTITLMHLRPEWVRTVWNDLQIHAGRYPFWYRWDPRSHPNEIAFAAANAINPAVNDRPPPLMKADMPINFLT